jgi:AcrR family transcriptional regulator
LTHCAKIVNRHDVTTYARDAETKLRPGWARRRAAAAFDIELAALRLYAERGVAAVTVDEIAAAAGISRRTFYRYFETPDDVIGAQGKRFLAQVSEQFRAQPATEPIGRAFLEAIRKVSQSKEEAEILRLARVIARKSPGDVLRAHQRAKARGSGLLETMIAARLRVTGQNPRDAGVIANMLLAIMAYVGAGGGGARTLQNYERALNALSHLAVKRAPPRSRGASTAASMDKS